MKMNKKRFHKNVYIFFFNLISNIIFKQLHYALDEVYRYSNMFKGLIEQPVLLAY